MSKNKSRSQKPKQTATTEDEVGLIWVDKQTDVLQTMECLKCNNPISIYSDYQCNRCKQKHWFKLKVK